MIIGISEVILYINKDGLHLIDKGKAFLADNFIVYLNNNTFLETHTHHPPKTF